MDVLGDAIARDRRSDTTALEVPAAGRSYDYRRFCTSAWKVGNLLRHHGVRGGDRVVVADDPQPATVLSLYGAASLGGVVQFGPSRSPGDSVRALLVPTADVDRYEVGPSTTRIAYGDPPTDPSVAHFERDVWSENPTEPPDQVDPGAPLLATPDGTFTHDDVLSAAGAVIEDRGLTSESNVAVDASFTHPGTVAGGLVAPIVAGGAASIGPGAHGEITVGGTGDVVPGTVISVGASR